MYRCKNLYEVYMKLGEELLKNGEIYKPRGMETKELLNVNFCIENPRDRLIYNPKRSFSLIHAIIESIMLISPSDELKYFSYFNKNMEQFSDDGVILNGAYGSRISYFVPYILDKLNKDKDSRQCVLPIYSNKDLGIKTKDIPCTLALHFMIRNNKLNLHVYMRSNDIIWGTPYDVFQFTMLQEILANELNLNIGKYYHNVTSLHVYQDQYKTLGNILSGDTVPVEVENPYNYCEWQEFAIWYKSLVDNDGKAKPINNMFANIIYNEVEYRNKSYKYLATPFWARLFSKRWFKC